MIICDICKKDTVHNGNSDPLIYGLLPVEMSQFGYKRSELSWADSNEGSGMTLFMHGNCLELLLKIGRDVNCVKDVKEAI